jgi:hypothetical protein
LLKTGDRILAERKSRRKGKSRRAPGAGRPSGRHSQEVRVRRADDEWELVHPRCACDRAEDIEEVQAMLAAGETEIARDEIRWLLQGCHDFIEAHKLLGEIAYGARDLPLARGHFGYAFRIGQQAIERAGNPRPLPYSLPGNKLFLESGKALVLCLVELDRRELATSVVEQLLSFDPSDPLGVRHMIATGQP